MTHTTGMDLVGRAYGKPFRQVMIDLYDEHRNVEKCAAVLGYTRTTLWAWRLRIGLTDTDLHAAIRDRDHIRAAAVEPCVPAKRTTPPLNVAPPNQRAVVNSPQDALKCCRNQYPTPEQHVVEQSDSWLAPDLLEMLMATVRTGLDGQEVVDLGAVLPGGYEQGELWWPLDRLRNDIRPKGRLYD